MRSRNQINSILAIFSYNCEKQIGRVLSEIDANLLGRFEKVIIIDNQSLDGTYKVAEQEISRINSPKYILHKNPSNIGLGGSHKVAFKKAREFGAEYLAILHGDHQARASELHTLMDEAQKNSDAAAILGSRFMSKSKRQGYSLLRTIGNMGLNFIYTLLTGRSTKDLGSGINVFKVLPESRLASCSNGFTFNMDLLLGYYTAKEKVIFVPISWFEEDQVSNAKTFKVGWTALKTVLKWRISQH